MPYFADHYTSEDQCLVDIMANTDAPYVVAQMAATKVYGFNWSFNNGPTDRSVVICPNFDDPTAPRITFSYEKGGEVPNGNRLCDARRSPDHTSPLCEFDKNDICYHCRFPRDIK